MEFSLVKNQQQSTMYTHLVDVEVLYRRNLLLRSIIQRLGAASKIRKKKDEHTNNE